MKDSDHVGVIYRDNDIKTNECPEYEEQFQSTAMSSSKANYAVRLVLQLFLTFGVASCSPVAYLNEPLNVPDVQSERDVSLQIGGNATGYTAGILAHAAFAPTKHYYVTGTAIMFKRMPGQKYICYPQIPLGTIFNISTGYFSSIDSSTNWYAGIGYSRLELKFEDTCKSQHYVIDKIFIAPAITTGSQRWQIGMGIRIGIFEYKQYDGVGLLPGENQLSWHRVIVEPGFNISFGQKNFRIGFQVSWSITDPTVIIDAPVQPDRATMNLYLNFRFGNH